jgi:hypothetical protein
MFAKRKGQLRDTRENAKCTDCALSDSATTTRNLRKGQLKPTRDSLTHLREPEQ